MNSQSLTRIIFLLSNNAILMHSFVVKKINSLFFFGMKLSILYCLCNTLGIENTFEIAVYYKMCIKDLIADIYPV